jgi:16S rRNA processing protein RimM
MTTDDPPVIEVGRVVKPHGVRGEVAVHLLTDRPDVRFASGAELLLDGEPVTVATGRPHQGRWLVRFEGVGDRTGAEGLRNAVLTAPPLEGDDDTDTFWVHELVGLTVVDEDGVVIGEVSDHIELPPAAGYDMLEVRRPSGTELLLPAVDELVEAREAADGGLVLVVVDPPAGLLDGDEAAVVRSPE